MSRASKILTISGWIFIATAIFIIAIGVIYGITGTKEFYQRIDDYYALDEERTALRNELDSLYEICYDYKAQENSQEDTIICPIQAEIDSIENSSQYAELLGIPEPPRGFSTAGLAAMLLIIMALVPMVLGIILLIIARRKRRASATQK